MFDGVLSAVIAGLFGLLTWYLSVRHEKRVADVAPKPSELNVNVRTRAKYWLIAVVVVGFLSALGVFYFIRSRKSPELQTKRPNQKIAIVVLPFTNVSADKNQEYFSDGLSEELLTELARNPKLQVTSRTSAFSFKGKQVDIKTIGEKLHVTHVLEGSVRKSANQLRIAAELIEVATDSQLWAEKYDRNLQNIFAIQDEIAASVADALKVALEGGRPNKVQQTNSEAYTAYLQGRYFADRPSKENTEKAMYYLNKALEIDPAYARAHVALSLAYLTQLFNGFVSKDQGLPKARAEVERALALDPNLPDAHGQLGLIKTTFDWDWNGADTALKRALELDRGNAEVLYKAAILAATLGRFDDAIALDQKATQLDPLNVRVYFRLGFDMFYAGRYPEAEKAILNELDLDPDSGHSTLSLIYLVQGKRTEALAEIQKEKEPVWRDQGLALIQYALGHRTEADMALHQYINTYQNEMAFQIAEIYAFRGEIDSAFDWLERAYNNHDPGLAQIKGDPLLRKIESDPRYRTFLQKMKLPV